MLISHDADAHPLDELVQMSFLAIATDSIDVEIDLTPGLRVAPELFSKIDGNSDGALSDAERAAFVNRAFADLTLVIDDREVPLMQLDARWPTDDQFRNAEGMVRIFASARLATLPRGTHRMVYRNDHAPITSSYLANPLKPSPPISIDRIRRDFDQHEMTVEFSVNAVAPPRPEYATFRVLIAISLIVVTATVLFLVRRRQKATKM